MAVVNETDDIEVGQYERRLSDGQLAMLAIQTHGRTVALIQQGLSVPLDQIASHHLLGLLEQIAGADEAMRVREWHLSWVDRQLDMVEAQMRMRLIESGILDGAQP